MRKAKFWTIAGIFIAAFLIIAGCSGGSTTPAAPVPVTGVSVADADGHTSTILWLNAEEDPDLPSSVTLTATVAPNNATDKSVTWSSSFPDKASVSPTSGASITVTAGTETGDATITVRTADGNKTAKYEIKVMDANDFVPVTAVAIQHVNQVITEFEFEKAGTSFNPETLKLTPKYTPENGTPKSGVTWTSDNPSVATVNGGEVTPVGAGTANITVTVNGTTIKASVEITVKEVDLGDYDPVESVSVTPTAVLTFTKTGEDPFTPASTTLEATVLPEGAFQGVTWTSDTPSVATVNNGVVTPVGAGTAKIYATSVGKDTNDATVKSNEVSVTVEVIIVTPPTAELVLYNQSGTGAGTTDDLEAAWNDTTKKYTIKNVDGGIAGGTYSNSTLTSGVTKATIVYLNTPVTGTTQAISARVRLTTSGTGTQGILVGLMTNPTGDIFFHGMRATANSHWRPYNSQTAATNSSTNLTAAPGSGYAETPPVDPSTSTSTTAPSLIDGVVIPFDEEFILEYERTGATTYTVRMKDYNGNTIASASRSGSSYYNTGLEYLGFIVAGVEVEISQIAIKNGGTAVFSTPASTPTPTPVASVEFTAPVSGPGPYSAYTHSTLSGTTLELAAKALPARAPQDISWAITGTGASLDTNSGTDVTATLTTAGSVSVTATAETKSATLPITVTSGDINANSIEIETPAKTTISAGDGNSNLGEELVLTAVTNPVNATNTVSWTVTLENNNPATGIATISYSDRTATLKASNAAITVDTNVVVTVSTANSKSDTVTITVKKYVAPTYQLKIAPFMGTTANGGEITSTVYNEGTEALTVTNYGRGTSTASGGAGFIYTPVTGVFTAEIEMSSYSVASANNASVIGLWVIDTQPVANLASYGSFIAGRGGTSSNSTRLVGVTRNSGNSSGDNVNGAASPAAFNNDPCTIKIVFNGTTIVATITQGSNTATLTATVTGLGSAYSAENPLYLGIGAQSSTSGISGVNTGTFKNFRIDVGNTGTYETISLNPTTFLP